MWVATAGIWYFLQKFLNYSHIVIPRVFSGVPVYITIVYLSGTEKPYHGWGSCQLSF